MCADRYHHHEYLFFPDRRRSQIAGEIGRVRMLIANIGSCAQQDVDSNNN
jgi:hypothetical protein